MEGQPLFKYCYLFKVLFCVPPVTICYTNLPRWNGNETHQALWSARACVRNSSKIFAPGLKCIIIVVVVAQHGTRPVRT